MANRSNRRSEQPAESHAPRQRAKLIGIRSTDCIRASGNIAASTGRTHECTRPKRHAQIPLATQATSTHETHPRHAERQPERHYESPARKAMLDQAMFGRREPDPNRRYPGENAAMLLQRLPQQEHRKSNGTA